MSDYDSKFNAAPNWEDFGPSEPRKGFERPAEAAFDRALKEVSILRERIDLLGEAIKPALQEESDVNAPSLASGEPEPPKSPVVRDFDNLRYEVARLASRVQSITDRVYL